MRLPTDGRWPDTLPAVEVRIARPTDQLDDVVTFYTRTLGLPELSRSVGDGYTVVMIGLPGDRYHLEFVSHVDAISGAAPTTENLLVLYFSGEQEMSQVRHRLRDAGCAEVDLDNPWWAANGAVAFPDPDGYRIVLMPRPVILSKAHDAPDRHR